MLVEQLMAREVAACKPLDTLNEAARLMWEKDCGCVPIFDEENTIIGIITDRDICMGALFHGKSLKEIPVAEVMQTDLVVCGPNAHLEMAEMTMEQNQVRRLPVVSTEGHLLGIVSLNDIALAYKHDGRKVGAKEVANTLAAICEHRHPKNALIVQCA